MPKINVIFHSVSGHPFRLAEAIAEGVSEVPRCQAKLLLIPEPHNSKPITMSGLEKRHHDYSHVTQAGIEDLVNCDGLALGSPIYWGSMSYAMKHFLDSAASLWALPTSDKPVKAPDLARKPATVFTAGGSGLVNDPGIISLWTALGCFGMTIVTLGLGAPHISEPARVDGGSPLGAGSFSRRPGPHPTAVEISIARTQGRYLAQVTRAWSERDRD